MRAWSSPPAICSPPSKRSERDVATQRATTDPLRLGILGATRIAPLSIVSPARATGTRLVSVAARDRDRAAAFAAANGVERVADSISTCPC